MFNLTTHSTHFIYGVGHMVKDHSDSESGNPLPPHGLLFPISSNGSFICTSSHRQDSTYHSLCYTSRGALAGTRNRSDDPSHHEQTLLPWSYISLHETNQVKKECYLMRQYNVFDKKKKSFSSIGQDKSKLQIHK